MNGLLKISSGIDWVTTKIGQVMWWLTFLMVLIGVENVIARYLYDTIRAVFGDSVARALSNNTYLELQWYLYSMVFLLGASYVFKSNSHVRVDIIYSMLKPRAQAIIDVFGILFLMFPFMIFGIYYSWPSVRKSWQQMEMSPDPGGLARYPIKTVVIVAFVLLLFQGISELIKNIAFLRGHPNSNSMHAKSLLEQTAEEAS